MPERKNDIYISASGRYRALAYKCARCGYTHFEIVTEKMRSDSEDNLQCYQLPEGWSDRALWSGTLCPVCTQSLKTWMANFEVDMI